MRGKMKCMFSNDQCYDCPERENCLKEKEGEHEE